MSHETRPSVTQPTHLEDLSKEYDEDDAREQQSVTRRRRRLLAGVALPVAAAVAAGVLYLGTRGDTESTEPRAEPGTSAPANPNTGAPSPAETAPAEPEANAANWTSENVPLYTDMDGDGKPELYVGQEALAEAFELRVEDYPTADAAAAAFVERTNTLLNWGNDPKTDKFYVDANVTSSDNELGGTAAVQKDYVATSFNNGLFAVPKGGVEILNNDYEGWMSTQMDLARQTGSRWVQSKDNQYPYFLKYELDEANGGVYHVGGQEAKGYYQYWINVKTVDNTEKADLPPELGAAPVEATTAWSVALQKQGETWEVIGLGFK